MNFDNFKKYFHPSYHSKVKVFIESKECDDLYGFLKSEAKRGVNLAPLSSATYRCFKETNLNTLKCVVIGTTPFEEFENGLPIADGLLFGSMIVQKVQPQLQNFYNAIEVELFNGLKVDYVREYDLTYLCKQDVLLFNQGLTTSKDNGEEHIQMWKPFFNYIMRKVIPSDMPVLDLRKNMPSNTLGKTWDSKRAFYNLDEQMMDIYGHSINWLNEDTPF
jgi:uracil DNA glycosylase